MPQALLPMIPHGATRVNDLVSVVRQDDHWTYFCGGLPMFQHPQDDRRSFRMFTAQLCCQGACTQAQIIRTFGVSKNSVLRSVAKYPQEGIDGFYRPRRKHGSVVMTAEVTARAERLLELGQKGNGDWHTYYGKLGGQGKLRMRSYQPCAWGLFLFLGQRCGVGGLVRDLTNRALL